MTLRRNPPLPASELKRNTYWHGTHRPSAVKSIMRSGVMLALNKEETWDKYGNLNNPLPWYQTYVPLPGRVYVTNDPTYALMYACPQYKRAAFPVGWMLQVNPGRLDVVVDEDELGEIAIEFSIPWLKELSEEVGAVAYYEMDVDEDDNETGDTTEVGSVIYAAKQGEYGAWVALGKLLHASGAITAKQHKELLKLASKFAILGEPKVEKVFEVENIPGEDREDPYWWLDHRKLVWEA